MRHLYFLLEKVLNQNSQIKDVQNTLIVIVSSIIIRTICNIYSAKTSFLASAEVKKTLREKIYEKLLILGASYHQKISTSEVVQVSVEGIEQLEIYFGGYLPQLVYSLLAPLTLFIILSTINLKSALVLLFCIPLIPISIVAVQKFAKKLLNKYWGIYTQMGDSFLENIQGLTTLKIYKRDSGKSDEMDIEAERFRKVTMRVLTMQLNSIVVMDVIAFGGAAIGTIISISEFMKGSINFAGAFIIIMLSSEFFIPLRLLGSFFHIAMNGMAASDKIFKILDMDYSIDIEKNNIIGIHGRSGSGKSTLLKLLMRFWDVDSGDITISGEKIKEIKTDSLRDIESYVTQETYLFNDTIANNIGIGKEKATLDDIKLAAKKASIDKFIRTLPDGYDTNVGELGDSLSSGEKQRIGIARAFLHDAPFMLLDEPTSNLDSLNEGIILKALKEESKDKTMILVSHRKSTMNIADIVHNVESERLS